MPGNGNPEPGHLTRSARRVATTGTPPPAGTRDSREPGRLRAPPRRTLGAVDTATAIGFAMTDYLLASGTNTASAMRAPDHMAAWLEAHGYRLVRPDVTTSTDPDDPEVVARIAAQIDWRSVAADADAQRSIVSQVLAAVAAAGPVRPGNTQVA